MQAKEIKWALKRIARSPEYLGLLGFIIFFEKACRPSLAKRVAKKYAKEVKILFRMLKKRIEREIDRFPSSAARIELARAVHHNLPAYSKYYDLGI